MTTYAPLLEAQHPPVYVTAADWAGLPVEIWELVVDRLKGSDLAKLCCVSRSFAHLGGNRRLWQRLCNRVHSQHLEYHRDWRLHYRDAVLADRNWREGRCTARQSPFDQGSGDLPDAYVTAVDMEGDVIAVAVARTGRHSTYVDVWDVGCDMHVCHMDGPGAHGDWMSAIAIQGSFVFAATRQELLVAWELPASFHDRTPYEAHDPKAQPTKLFQCSQSIGLGEQYLDSPRSMKPCRFVFIAVPSSSPHTQQDTRTTHPYFVMTAETKDNHTRSTAMFLVLDRSGSVVQRLHLPTGSLPSKSTLLVATFVRVGAACVVEAGSEVDSFEDDDGYIQCSNVEVAVVNILNGRELQRVPLLPPVDGTFDAIDPYLLCTSDLHMDRAHLFVVAEREDQRLINVWDLEPIIQGRGDAVLVSNIDISHVTHCFWAGQLNRQLFLMDWALWMMTNARLVDAHTGEAVCEIKRRDHYLHNLAHGMMCFQEHQVTLHYLYLQPLLRNRGIKAKSSG